jgi:hypothetical protein
MLSVYGVLGFFVLLSASVSMWIVGVGMPAGDAGWLFDALFFSSNIGFIGYTVLGAGYLLSRTAGGAVE